MGYVRPVILVFVAWSLSGCASPQYTSNAPPESAHQTLSEGYALLHTLMAQNQRVGGIFMVKSAPSPFKELIVEIAQECAAARTELESLVEADPLLSIEGANLPEIEVQTRNGIEKTVSAELLGSNEAEFTKRLAIEQIKATRYAALLAQSLAATDENKARVDYLHELSERFNGFHDRLQATLVSTL